MPNRLINEKSPYLLQHANNPVDWFPWGQEAFDLAQKEDKPIFLSIGYATCHWCHVMERESFEDPAIAEILNAHFVPIKLDREERPDVDQIYMRALHAQGVQGGWPLNMFLTPDKRPMVGDTYFPPRPAHGKPSFGQVLEAIAKNWKEQRPRLLEAADSITGFLNKHNETQPGAEVPGPVAFDRAITTLKKTYDPANGGFVNNGPNKFPPSLSLQFLLTWYQGTRDASILEMVENTIDHMLRGGIYDQLGGGLARYATDHTWLVPHFEKMLYDNALFCRVLVETYRFTGKEEYRQATLNLLDYIERDMTSPEGAFFSAEDADSEGVEGKFYVWEREELEESLGFAGFDRKDVDNFLLFWGVSDSGNFDGKNILSEMSPRADFLATSGYSADDWDAKLEKARLVLREVRSGRKRPLLDDKILISWNALMIRALAQAGRAFQSPELTERAVKAADFIFDKMRDDKDRLLRRFREGDARYPAVLQDYAQYGLACVDLYRALGDTRWLARARELAVQIIELFDHRDGIFYETAADADDLILRAIEGYDGVEPSGNSSAAGLFSALAAYGVNVNEYNERVEKILRYFKKPLEEYGTAQTELLSILHNTHEPRPEIAIVAQDIKSQEVQDILDWMGRHLPGDCAVAWTGADDAVAAAGVTPLLENRTARGDVTIYVCRNQACSSPVGSLEEMKKLLERSKA